MQQLTDRAKKVSDKNMTFAERIYLPAVVGGLGITIKHFFRKKPTIEYPEVQRPMSAVFRGLHVLKRDDEGRERCTACGLCALSCPAEAISMISAERRKGEEKLYREEKYAEVYEINMLRCIFCGFCEEACPKQAIYLQADKLAPAFYTRADIIYGKDRLLEPWPRPRASDSPKAGRTATDRYVDPIRTGNNTPAIAPR